MPTLVELLEAGAHFGHKKEKSFPRSKQFTYTIRDNIYVINLEMTVTQIKVATDYLKKAISAGKSVLFVGTKTQVKDIVKETAENLNMPYITQRWLGGTLTNFESIRKSLKTLNDLEAKIISPEFSAFTKKERLRIEEKKNKLNLIFEGIREMKNLPDALFIVDTHKESVAVKEAIKSKIPIVGICDTNADPDLIDVPIPANDDSQKTVTLILKTIEAEIKKDLKAGDVQVKAETEVPKVPEVSKVSEVKEVTEVKKEETKKPTAKKTVAKKVKPKEIK